MKKILYFLPLLFSGCASMYIPPMASAPLFEEKGEKQVAVSVSSNSVSLSFADAFSEKYAVMLDGNVSYGNFTDYNDAFTKKGTSSRSYTDLSIYGKYSHRYFEASVGRFNLTDNENFKLEAFLGAGYGIADEVESSENYHNKYALAFAQVNLGQHVNWFEWGTSVRLSSSLNMFDWNDDYNKAYNQNFYMFHFEPMIFCRLGGEHLKFEPRVGLSLPVSSSSFDFIESKIKDSDYYRTTLLHVSLGLHYKF
ncbi:MAG: hypothetical protein MJ198_00205 [Bacteroidales bacterium]|nr:hypothetical protein [Bacteroidales bacterium]